MLENRNSIGEEKCFGHVMGHEQRGQTEIVVNAPILSLQRGARHGIESTERFVHQHDAGPCSQGTRDANSLLLATGNLVGHSIFERGRFEPNQFQKLADPSAHVVGGPPE